MYYTFLYSLVFLANSLKPASVKCTGLVPKTKVNNIAECKQKGKDILEVWTTISLSEREEDSIKNNTDTLSEPNNLCKFIIDLQSKKCKRRIYNTQMEFAKADHNSQFLIGLKDEHTIVRFNKLTEGSCEYKFKERISELCIVDDDIHYIYLKSDDIKGESSVVISDKEFMEICSVEVPYCEHSSFS
tara:strand:- start:45 stop:605 length:561 start_codon:yes stop_codon:yes gene_type:complete